MSAPLTQCLISKAVFGNKKDLEIVLETMKINKRYGHFLTGPCNCNPPCKEPSREQIDELNIKIAEATKDIIPCIEDFPGTKGYIKESKEDPTV
jgi:hypothetical protein